MSNRKCNCDNPLNCVTCLREDVAALQHANRTLTRQAEIISARVRASPALAANDELRRENARLKRSETFYRELTRIHESHARGEYWAWQSDDEDYIKSLTCPALIPAQALRDIIAERDAAREKITALNESIMSILANQITDDDKDAYDRMDRS